MMKILAAGAFLALLTACAATQPSRAPAEAQSGFLHDYSVLASDPRDPGFRYYTSPDLRPGEYRSFLIEDLSFIINTAQGYQALDTARLKDLSDYYTSQMTAMLRARQYKIVKAAGPGVVRLRVAVVGATQVAPQFKVTDLVPAKALFNAARMATDTSPRMLRMSIEGEALDSTSGRLLGATIDGRESGATVAGRTTPPSADQVHELIDFWVTRFGERLDRIVAR
ncbi:MAG: DUF3313 domain-containing protein [Castellaniella sp.]|jgi:hypothetical protein|uniref:DUF3313 domain-containing protein n=1 Tax=Castellaniella sp. TaxID=1955812 RepID=UPI003C7477B8